MSNLLKQIKQDITASVISSDITRRNILKVVVGEAEMTALRQNKDVTDDMLLTTMKKVLEGNTVTLETGKASNATVLKQENAILKDYLPKTLNADQMMAHLEPLKEQIKAGTNVNQVIGLVMKTFKAASLPVDSKAVIEIINKIRG